LVELLEGAGQILAEPVAADRNFPPFARATRDGYAVRSADLARLPATLEIVGEIKAGADVSLQVGPAQAVSIMTGAAAPAGADAVVMVEYSSLHGKQVEISRAVKPGDNIVPAGSEAKRGERLLSPGMRMDHKAIAVAASVGRARLLVYSKPKIAVLSTGDEIVDIDAQPSAKQIRNSNSYSLAAQVHAAGGEPVILPTARDEAEELALLLRKGLESDLLLITGGVSMGKYDLVEQVLASFNATLFFTGVRIQPGRPVVFGEVRSGERGTPLFGLPGNPVSTMVTFDLFARPVMDALAGAKPQPLRFAQALLKSEFTTKTGLTRFLPAVVGGSAERPEVELIRWQGSGDLMAASRANCYIVVPPERERFAAGEPVAVLVV